MTKCVPMCTYDVLKDIHFGGVSVMQAAFNVCAGIRFKLVLVHASVCVSETVHVGSFPQLL